MPNYFVAVVDCCHVFIFLKLENNLYPLALVTCVTRVSLQICAMFLVLKVSLTGPLAVLIYIKDMSEAASANLLLYAN